MGRSGPSILVLEMCHRHGDLPESSLPGGPHDKHGARRGMASPCLLQVSKEPLSCLTPRTSGWRFGGLPVTPWMAELRVTALETLRRVPSL